MKAGRSAVRGALIIGVGPRLAAAILIVMSLWAMFFWATSTLGNP